MKTTTLLLVKKAAEKGTLSKGTWSHCVFNAAGDECGINVKNMKSAKAVDPLAQEFISKWDSLRGYTTSDLLRDVDSVLSTRELPTPVQEVSMGRVSGVRRRRIAESTLYTMADFEAELNELIDA